MNIIILSTIIFATSISILFGLRHSYLYIKAIIHKQDLIKNKKHLIYSFIYLFLIPLFLMFFLNIVSSIGLSKTVPLLSIKSTNNGYQSNLGYMSLKSQEIKISKNKKIELTIKNKDNQKKELYIDIECISIKCNSILIPEKNKIIINPGISLILPITINQKQSKNQKTRFNISLKDKEEEIHDSIILTLSLT